MKKEKKIKKYLFILILLFGYVFLLILSVAGAYSLAYRDRVYPGIYINKINFGNKEKREIKAYFEEKNKKLARIKFSFKYEDRVWEIDGEKIKISYNLEEIAEKAYSFGRSGKMFQDLKFKWQIFLKEINFNPIISYQKDSLYSFLKVIALEIDKDPVEGLFEFKDGKIILFKPYSYGKKVNIEQAVANLTNKITEDTENREINISTETIKPKQLLEEADKMGITELISTGESSFKNSDEARRHNIYLASSKFHGIIIEPEEIFSFNQRAGNISAFTGYKQAYVIKEGKTILGDGGGVCQVSTTIYRAALKAGLPILERTPHSYRVGYYEPPIGFDASVYDPSLDLKFKNDTGKYLLVQLALDETNQMITVQFYGTFDGRTVIISEPVITANTPAPEPKYQDDPNLPKGTEKQIDSAHPGAKVYFNRTVIKNGQELIKETVWSNYIPWSAVIARGTKE